MDPEATLRAAESAMDSRQWDECVDHLQAYRQWRLRDGFEPDDGDLRYTAILHNIPASHRRGLWREALRLHS